MPDFHLMLQVLASQALATDAPGTSVRVFEKHEKSSATLRRIGDVSRDLVNETDTHFTTVTGR